MDGEGKAYFFYFTPLYVVWITFSKECKLVQSIWRAIWQKRQNFQCACPMTHQFIARNLSCTYTS